MASGRGLVGLGFVKVWTVFLAYHLEWQGEATPDHLNLKMFALFNIV